MKNEFIENSKIMIVDDQPENLGILFEYLDVLNADVMLVQDGTEAIKLAEAKLPDIILLDIIMPEINGFEVCKKLKENEKTADIPVIFISALSDTENVVRGFEYGAIDYVTKRFEAGGIDYVTKPIQKEEVIARISNQLKIRYVEEELRKLNSVLEQRVAERTLELETAYNELKSAQSRILQSEKMASIGQLSAGIAHEINNPIGFIGGNLRSLEKYINKFIEFMESQSEVIREFNITSSVEELEQKRKKLKIDYIIGDIKELIRESIDGTERVTKIVRDLKSFSRISQEIDIKYTCINECIESTLNIVWNELKYKAKIIKEYGNIPQTKCYPQQLTQVFMNLLVNASQAMEKYGEIVVKTWNDNESIYISIADTGCGIKEENLNKIFDPFFTTKEVGKGTGLGLSISYDIVKKHNGEIIVQSNPGKGTLFTIKIPIVKDRSCHQ